MQLVGTDTGFHVPPPRAPRGRWREARTITLLAPGAREAGGTEAPGALAGAPVQTGLTELAGVLLVLTEVSCGPGRSERAWAGAARRPPHAPPLRPRWGQAGPHTFEAIRTQALELVLAGRHARGAVPARLALTRGAGIALPDAPAAQEAVG